jgi:hypothetical protein
VTRTYDICTDYGWSWIEGEDDNEGETWIEIAHLGEEIAVIICRDYETVKRDHPEWIAQKERDATMIVRALNRQAAA